MCQIHFDRPQETFTQHQFKISLGKAAIFPFQQFRQVSLGRNSIKQDSAFTLAVFHFNNGNIQCRFNRRLLVLPNHQRNALTAELPYCNTVVFLIPVFAEQHRHHTGVIYKANALQLILGCFLPKGVHKQEHKYSTAKQQICGHTVFQHQFQYGGKQHHIITGRPDGALLAPYPNKSSKVQQEKNQFHRLVSTEDTAEQISSFHSPFETEFLILCHRCFLLSRSPRLTHQPYTG